MPTQSEILKEKFERLDSEPNRFISSVSDVEQQVFDRVKNALKKLEVDASGNIVLSQSNFAEINRIKSIYDEALSKSGYYKNLTSFVDEFNVQKELNDRFLKTAIPDFKTGKTFDNIYKNGEQAALTTLGDNAVNMAGQNLLDLLNNSIANGDNILDLTENISTSIRGNNEVDGSLTKTAKLNSKDIYAVSERGYTSALAKNFGIQFYYYSGGEQDTTRCFCEDRIGQTYHIEEIKAWGRGENLGSCGIGGGKWAGQAKGTNENTIMSLAGGYNCGHSFIPRGLKDVPAKDLNRAIEKGFIKLEDLPEDIQKRLG